ncbi:MAG: thiamine phosphate synthase [Desulfobacterales bacterium]|nr:thiamine phosphate synthase [Desulfobacterales bacterium]
MALGADGVHLTRKSLPPREARALVGPDMLLGVSCHNLDDVREAVDGGVDFLVLGPIYATPSKASYGPPLTPEILRQRSDDLCDLPILAIGGIGPERVPEVMAAGADGVAVDLGRPRRSRSDDWRHGRCWRRSPHAKGVE